MANLKVAPHSIEAEKSTLGSILIDQDALIKIVDILDPADFYVPANELVFTAILSLFNKRVNIDMITVTAYLQDHNQMQSVGGPAYLTELVEEVPTSTNVFQYATIVQQKATLRKLLKAGQKITALGFKEDTDVDNLLEDAEKSLFQVSQTFVKDKFIHIQDVLSDTYEKIADLHDPDAKQKFAGIPYGFREIDKITTGLHPSDLIVLAARPSMGKTALALNIAQNVAKSGKSVGIISLEMSKEQLVERLFCSLLEVDSWKIKTGQLQEQDFARIGPIMDQLNSLNIFIDDSLGNSVVELRAKTRRLQMEHGLDLLIIDYLQLMTSGKGGFSNNRVNEISEISRSLKSLARELNIPVIAMSQLSRAVEMRPNKEPVLSDLRDSGAIEQDADLVFMLYRHDYYYNDDSDKKGILDVLIRKHRNGALGQVELRFDKAKMKFYDIDRNQNPPPEMSREHSGLQVQAQEPMHPQRKSVPDF
jgi:replicative DNA helicase